MYKVYITRPLPELSMFPAKTTAKGNYQQPCVYKILSQYTYVLEDTFEACLLDGSVYPTDEKYIRSMVEADCSVLDDATKDVITHNVVLYADYIFNQLLEVNKALPEHNRLTAESSIYINLKRFHPTTAPVNDQDYVMMFFIAEQFRKEYIS